MKIGPEILLGLALIGLVIMWWYEKNHPQDPENGTGGYDNDGWSGMGFP